MVPTFSPTLIITLLTDNNKSNSHENIKDGLSSFFNFIFIHTHPVHMILILSTQLTFHTNKGRNRLQLTDSRTLDTGLTFWCTRPVVYQPHEVTGELFETQIFVSPPRRLRVCVLNIGSDRKLGKRQISISKQM